MASSVEVVARRWESSPFTRAIIGSFPGIEGFTDRRMIGNALSLMAPFFHENRGSKAAIHGYPSIMSSFPMFVTRNCICLWTLPVCIWRTM